MTQLGSQIALSPNLEHTLERLVRSIRSNNHNISIYYQKQSIYITNHDTVKDINGSESRKTHSLQWIQMDSALLNERNVREKSTYIFISIYL